MKVTFFSSPGSTVAPSPTQSFLSDADTENHMEYQTLPEQASPDSLWESGLLATKGSHKKFGLDLIFYLLLLTFGMSGIYICVHVQEPKQPKMIKIWNPDIQREFSTEPLAKSVIRKFDAYNMARGGKDDADTFNANVEVYMSPNVLYESVGFGTWKTPAGWAAGEETRYGNAFPETIFTQMLFFGDHQIATTTTYGKAFWSGEWMNVKAANKWVTLRITDFYYIKDARISYNFMMIDWVDALRQIGIRMLPPAPLEEGLVLPPAANDGVPAPLSAIVQAEGRDAKTAHSISEEALQQDWAGVGDSVQNWHKSLTYYGPGGIGLARNISDYTKHVVGPFRAAFADRKAKVELSTCEGNYCAFFGVLSGRGMRKWLGLPTVGRHVSFRFAMHYRVMGNKVQEGWTIFDFPGLFAEVGLDFYGLAASGGRF